MASVVKIPIGSLEKGMVIVKFDKSGVSYAYYGRPLPDISIVNTFKQEGVKYAFIRTENDHTLKMTDNNQKTPSAQEYIETLCNKSTEMIEDTASINVANPTINEMNQMIMLHSKTKEVASSILLDVKMGKMADTSAAKDIVTELVTNCIKNPEAFTNIARLKDFDNYTYTHSVNVAVLGIAIARRLGSSADEMNKIGVGGLLHDIGKMRIPDNILNKPGKLTPEEYEIMKLHTIYGCESLDKYDKISKSIYPAVRHHHEKSDGSGYPDGLQESSIPKIAKVIAIADVYDAITSERIYHKGMVPSDALKIIFSWSGKHFNDALVKFFISIMGIYPAGTLVMLDTHELAVILEPNKNDPVRPKVLLVTDTSNKAIVPMMFDLSSYNVITRQPYKSIVSALDSRDFSIDTNRIIEDFIKTNIATGA